MTSHGKEAIDLVIGLEKSLMTNELRHNLAEAGSLLHKDFVEISQSGRKYGKAEVLEAFKAAPLTGSNYETSDFEARLISDGLAQITFETISIPKGDTVPKKALRSSLWKYESERWQMIFHQATIAR